VTPAVYLAHLGVLTLAQAALAIGFLSIGYGLVSLFFAAQLVAVGMAAMWHAIHAADCDHIHVDEAGVSVESVRGLRRRVRALPRYGVHAYWCAHSGLHVRHGRTDIQLGRFRSAAQERAQARRLAALFARGPGEFDHMAQEPAR
jgi:uncharacterized membrane protein